MIMFDIEVAYIWVYGIQTDAFSLDRNLRSKSKYFVRGQQWAINVMKSGF